MASSKVTDYTEITVPSSNDVLYLINANSSLDGFIQYKNLFSGTAVISSNAVWIGNASGELTELAAGSSGEFLGLSTGVPDWIAPISSYIGSTMTTGSLLLGAAGAVSSLAIGASGTYLHSSGGTAKWASVAAGGGGSTALSLMAREAHLPFGSSITAASVQMHTSTVAGDADPKPRWTEIVFATAAIEHIQWDFMAPANYASAPVVDIYYKPISNIGAGTSVVEFGAYLAAVTPGDAADMDVKGFDTVNWANSSVGSSGFLRSISIAMANDDSIAAGDMCILDVCRNGPGSTDTKAGVVEVPMVRLRYTAV